MDRILRSKEARRCVGLGRTTFEQRYVHTGRLRPVKLGERAVGFLESEITALIDELAAERDAPTPKRVRKAAS